MSILHERLLDGLHSYLNEGRPGLFHLEGLLEGETPTDDDLIREFVACVQADNELLYLAKSMVDIKEPSIYLLCEVVRDFIVKEDRAAELRNRIKTCLYEE